MSENSKNSLDKFENLIFSNLIPNENNIKDTSEHINIDHFIKIMEMGRNNPKT